MLLFQHLGLGDHILCNGMVRVLARGIDELTILVRPRNLPAVSLMFEDLANVKLHGVSGDEEAAALSRSWRASGRPVMLNGMHDPSWRPQYRKAFDAAFYRMADVPLEARWSEFQVGRRPATEEHVFDLIRPEKPYAFVHDDISRGYWIPTAKLAQRLNIVRPAPGLTDNLFDFRRLIGEADEIHCISSSFAHWIEAENIGQRRFLHRSARQDGTWCTFKNFEIVENWQQRLWRRIAST